MPTKKREPKTKHVDETPQNAAPAENQEESEVSYLKRRVDELLRENTRLESESLCSRAEAAAFRINLKSSLESKARLLAALIADGAALKIYREQALTETNRSIARLDSKGDKSSTVWSAAKWEPLATDADGAGAYLFSMSASVDGNQKKDRE